MRWKKARRRLENKAAVRYCLERERITSTDPLLLLPTTLSFVVRDATQRRSFFVGSRPKMALKFSEPRTAKPFLRIAV
jgi:hypothetical protein